MEGDDWKGQSSLVRMSEASWSSSSVEVAPLLCEVGESVTVAWACGCLGEQLPWPSYLHVHSQGCRGGPEHKRL